MVSIENQFRAVALPGDHFTLCVWKTGENEALFRMVKDSDGKSNPGLWTDDLEIKNLIKN